MNRSRIIIVDDEEVVRDALCSWLANDYQTVCFDSAYSLLNELKRNPFKDDIHTLILIDLKMPNKGGLELQKELQNNHVLYPIIFMSGNALQVDIIQAWHQGAVDFILKPFSAQQISLSIEKTFEKLISNDLIKSSHIKVIDSFPLPITRREAQVLLLLGQGKQQAEVAAHLGISLRTVKMYRAFLKNKLSLHTQMELGRYYDKHVQEIHMLAQYVPLC